MRYIFLEKYSNKLIKYLLFFIFVFEYHSPCEIMHQVKAFSKNQLLLHLKIFFHRVRILSKSRMNQRRKLLRPFQKFLFNIVKLHFRISMPRTTHYMTNLFPYFHHPLFNSAFLAFQFCCLYRQEEAVFNNPCYKRFRRAMSAKFVSISQPYKGV